MRQKDEMEQKIANKSIKITWFIIVMVLFIIGMVQQFNSGGQNIFLILASFSALFPLILERFYLSKINEDRSFIQFITLIVLLTAILLLIVWWSGS